MKRLGLVVYDLIGVALEIVGFVAAASYAFAGDWDTAWKIATVVLLMLIVDELQRGRA